MRNYKHGNGWNSGIMFIGVHIFGNYMIVFPDIMRNGRLSYTVARGELMLGAFAKLRTATVRFIMPV